MDAIDTERLTLLNEMASSMAHELNQPLTAICTYIDCCRRYTAPPHTDKLMAVVEKIAAQAQQAADIIARVRGLMQRQRAPREWVDPNELIRQSVELTATLAHKHRGAIELRLSDHLPLIEVDAVQIRQVLQNLIVNAFEATTTNQLGLNCIRIYSTTTRSGDVLIEVCDNGRGFSEADALHLFTPFFTTKPQGIGLGLSISESIVRAHRGRLWATRNPEGGATFHVELPGPKETDHATLRNHR